MRWGLIAWIGFGLALLGVKAMLDLSSARHRDIAVHAGADVYHVPRSVVLNEDTVSADLARLSGCWDAREAGMVPAAASFAGCHEPRALHLELSRLASVPPLLARHASGVALWRNYEPPAQHLDEILPVAGRAVTYARADWGFQRLDVPGTPWVYLFTRPPLTADVVRAAYAGRCFRSDIGTDIGMTCTVVERLPGGAAFEYSLGPDGVAELAPVRAEVNALLAAWRA